MPPALRARIEPHLGVELGGVRVHTGADAAHAAASLSARAFTVGSDIFLGRAESPHDLGLMAHEAAHVVQQGAVGLNPYLARSPEEIQLLPDFITDRLASYARHIPGYTLFTVIIGFNPLTGEDVERTPINLVEGLMGLVPFGTFIFDQLRSLGVLDAAFEWVERQLAAFDLSLSRLERVIEEAWDEMDFIRLDPFDYNIGVLRRHVGGLLTDVTNFAGSVVDKLMELIKEALIGVADDLLAENQAWALIKKVLHHDPLRDEPVEATTVEILEDFLMLIGKEQELEQMRVRGTLQQTADWLDTQIATFLDLLAELSSLFMAAWEAIQPANLPDLMTNLESLVARTGAFLQRVWDFAATVALQVLQLIKDALLGWLSEFANEVPGFHLLTVILGRNPFTGEPVPRTPVNLIRGFITLIPGGNAIYAQLEETGVVTEAGARIEGAISELGISWDFIVGIFTGIWDGLSIDDLIDPIGAFTRIRDQFGEPISRLFAFIRVVVEEIFKLILALMNFPVDILGRIITNAMQAFEDIKRDPIGFLVNMLEAVKLGFSNFFDNFLTHLVNGLVEWLFGGLREAGVEPPADLSLGSILETVLEILGLTMERIWEKLAERFGQETVDRIRGAIDQLVGIWNFIRDVQERGIGAIWEYIESQISNLWNMVLEAATQWIMEKIITRVTAKLLSMLDPTGIMAVVNSFIAFFNAVQSAIEYIREILEIIDSYVATIAAVAAGDIEPGAARMEGGLAAAIPVAIGFLANQVGLGNIGEKMQEIIEGVRGVVDRALDWLLDRLEEVVQTVLRAVGLGAAEEDTAEEDADVDATDHAAVGAAVVRQLQAVDNSGNYETVRTLLEQRARQLEQQWSSRLEEGVGLRVEFSDPAEDRADQDIDMRVVIAPNTSTTPATVAPTPFPAAWGNPPRTDVHEIGSGAEAQPLFKGHGVAHGTSNRRANAQIVALNAALGEGSTNWKGLHLVNHDLGGPNRSWNLWPGDTAANNQMLRDSERPAKAAVDGLTGSDVMWYRTVITDTWTYDGEQFVKSGYTEFGVWDPPYNDSSQRTTHAATTFESSDPNAQGAGATASVSILSAGRVLLEAFGGDGINDYKARGIVAARPFTNRTMRRKLKDTGRFNDSDVDYVWRLLRNRGGYHW